MKMTLFKKIRSMAITIVAGLFLCVQPLAQVEAATPKTDEFIRGYATAILQRDFQIGAESMDVRQGVVYIRGLKDTNVTLEQIQTSLSSIQGVRQVIISKEGDFPAREEKKGIEPKTEGLLPRNLLFKSLLADPRWPQFSASLQRYIRNDHLKNVGSATFGESFSIYRFGGPWDSQMEVGIQAGVFSIFDMDSNSRDLQNADYFLAIPVSLRKDNVSIMTRIFHQSSHLGDEFLLSAQTEERINLSYEGLDTILSYDLPVGFRIYGGGGFLFAQQPSDLKSGFAQSGLEFRSPMTWRNGAIRPVAGVDLQKREENEWNTDVSVRTGIQFENPDFLSRRMQILLEYYDGRSPNGQFYDRNVQFIGIGVHFYYD